MKKTDYQEMRSIGQKSLSNWATLEIIKVDTEEERVFYCLNNGGKREKVRYAKLHFNSYGDPYFATPHGKVNLAEVIITKF